MFPSDRVEGRATINGARGLHPRIRDRFDLTLECIRRFYRDIEPNPLGAVLARHAPFFGLFRDFHGYVDFFLLHDLVTEDAASVRFFTDAVDLASSPLPRDLDVYLEYLRRGTAFVMARNARIREVAL